MPKIALSVTLDETNLLWLRGRVAGGQRRSLSDALDQLLTQARQGGHGSETPRSVAGTIDIASDDLGLEDADGYVQSLFEASVSRPLQVRGRSRLTVPSRRPSPSRKPRRG